MMATNMQPLLLSLWLGCVLQAIPKVPRLMEGLNPATWMLQVSTPGMESTIGVDFAEIYCGSDLYKCATPSRPFYRAEMKIDLGRWAIIDAYFAGRSPDLLCSYA